MICLYFWGNIFIHPWVFSTVLEQRDVLLLWPKHKKHLHANMKTNRFLHLRREDTSVWKLSCLLTDNRQRTAFSPFDKTANLPWYTSTDIKPLGFVVEHSVLPFRQRTFFLPWNVSWHVCSWQTAVKEPPTPKQYTSCRVYRCLDG